MRIDIFVFLTQYTIFYGQFYYVDTSPLYGPNVRSARRTEFPFIVSLMRVRKRNGVLQTDFICTGSLITRKDVASSEHCMEGENIRLLKVVAGSIDFNRGRKHGILWWISYDQWATQNNVQIELDENDVNNIRLQESVGNEIIPGRISNLRNQNLYGLVVQTAGWSLANNTVLNPILKTVNLKVLTNSECTRRVEALAQQNVYLDKRQALCTVGEPFAIVNSGDSGGPLIYNNEIIGINRGTVPFNVEELNSQLINLHMAMQYYRTFLLSIIQVNSQ